MGEIPGYLHQGGSEGNGVGLRKKLNSDAIKNKGLSHNTSHDPWGILTFVPLQICPAVRWGCKLLQLPLPMDFIKPGCPAQLRAIPREGPNWEPDTSSSREMSDLKRAVWHTTVPTTDIWRRMYLNSLHMVAHLVRVRTRIRSLVAELSWWVRLNLFS